MTYTCTADVIADLEKHKALVRIPHPVDPDLEMAEIHRRVHQAGGPAIFYEKVNGSPFPAASNLYGTLDRARFIFRHTLDRMQRLIRLAADPPLFFKSPFSYADLPRTLWHMLPQKVKSGPVTAGQTRIGLLPRIRCWPDDGGPFILLPQVYTEDPVRPNIFGSNMGMYRIQLSGTAYAPEKEIGLHYQIRRDIAGHHATALEKKAPLRVSIFVGGPPAHAFAAIMPLPEGMPEATFAGGLAERRFRFIRKNGYVLSADADFCITGSVFEGETRPEGPFGDHLGYYSLAHPFPVIHVDAVYHRPGAVWPFTVVGRPPQEDSVFGRLIHDITGPMVPRSVPGLTALHAVDAAGVHPLLLAVGHERFVPWEPRRPRELLKIANAVLGFGACALAKYLFIAAYEDRPTLDIHDIAGFFQHILERVDWRMDLHFQTATTMDTLDYSGTGINEGSKVVVAAAGPPIRTLMTEIPKNLSLPNGFNDPAMALPGILAVTGPAFSDMAAAEQEMARLADRLGQLKSRDDLPLVLVVDDALFTTRHINNFLWIVFTRSNPSHDIYGVNSAVRYKHWGCECPLIIDARLKTHHAPPLIENPEITKRVDELGKKGGCLYGII
jgi:4-hydroxy-3-polyprenylbenzoate decarboxylase